MKYFLYILFLVISIKINAQLLYLAHPYKVFSENGEYFIKSIPFSDQTWTDKGKTMIFQTKDTSKAIITINRYFQPDLLFLSNDGKSFCFINNYNHCENAVLFYNNGNLIKKYNCSDFIDDSLIANLNYLFYYNKNADSIIETESSYKYLGFKKGTDSINKYLNTYHSFTQADTLYLFAQNKFLNKFNLTTGELIEKISIQDYIKSKLIYPNKRITRQYEIKIPNQTELPRLANGDDFCIALANYMNILCCRIGDTNCNSKYRDYRIDINCVIDSTGKCIDLQTECLDSTIRWKTESFLKNTTFNKLEIPQGIEKWYFEDVVWLRNKSIEIAQKERELEIIQEEFQYELRLISDSINGVYIPKDIYDCFKQLDLILKPCVKNEFKNSSEYSITKNCHMGLGLWIRNSWGLWSGSRLSYYFNTLGVFEPDNMSSIILISYYRLLNNQVIDFDKQIDQHQEYDKIKPRKKYNN